MEEEQVIDNNYTSGAELGLTGQSISFIRETAKWAKFLAIVGFIGAGFMIIMGLFMGTFLSMMGVGEEIPGFGGMGASLGIFYIVFAFLYLYPCYQLFKFSKLAKQAIASNDTGQMTIAFGHMKSLFKFMGILTIMMLAFYFLLLIGGVIMGAALA